VYKLDRRNTVRDRIVDLEVRKLELGRSTPAGRNRLIDGPPARPTIAAD
jgi:hypothetical protein